MARRKDLGGLAALAGLAYMASRDKATKGGADGAAMDAMTSGAYGGPEKEKEKEKVDAGAIFAEDGGTSKLRRNTETGDLYSPDEPITRPVAAKPRPRATPTPMDVMTSGPYGGPSAEKKKLQYQSLQDRARSYEQDRARSGVGMYGTRKTPRREDMPDRVDEMGNPYKKGGSVKGWGSARGARKAKIY